MAQPVKPAGQAKEPPQRRRYSSKTHIGPRRTLALLLLVLVAVTFKFGYDDLMSASSNVDQMENVSLNENITQLIDIKREESAKLFDVALLVGGAIFALFIAKKDEAKIVFADVPEIVMFGSAVALLIASVLCNTRYQDLLASALLVGQGIGSMPNIFVTEFEAFHTWQWRFLAIGVFAAAVTLISAHRLKGADHELER